MTTRTAETSPPIQNPQDESQAKSEGNAYACPDPHRGSRMAD